MCQAASSFPARKKSYGEKVFQRTLKLDRCHVLTDTWGHVRLESEVSVRTPQDPYPLEGIYTQIELHNEFDTLMD